MSLVEYAVRELRRSIESTSLGTILRSDATFVPIPKSAPLVANAVWASRSICRALLQANFGRDWQELIIRVRACKKSALCSPTERPKPIDHYETMRGVATTLWPSAIVMVDDVVTKGTTFMAACARLREIYSDVPIVAFAIARTSSEFVNIRQPCTGEILLSDPNAWPRRRDFTVP